MTIINDQNDFNTDNAETAKPIIEPVDLFGTGTMSVDQDLLPGMLPDVIYNYAVDTAERMGINAGPIALSAIIAAAATIRAGWHIQPKINDTTWTEKPILWGAISGNTGAKKTSSMSAGVKPAENIETEMNAEAQEIAQNQKKLWAVYNEDMRFWKSEFKRLKKEGASSAEIYDILPPPAEPVTPPMQRIVVKDTTTEQLMKICADNPAGVALVRDELAGWIASFDMYNGGNGGRDRAAYLSAWNGSSETVDRVSREDGPLRVESFAVSILGGIQDETLAQKMKGGAADGFLARFLFVRADIRQGCDRAPDAKINQDYQDLFNKLAGMTLDLDPTQIHDGKIWMSDEAAKIREEIEDIYNTIQFNMSIKQGLKDHINKWPAIFSRMCLIFHMIDCTSRGKNPKFFRVSEQVARGVYRLLTEYFLPEAARMYNDVLGNGEQSVAHMRQIADFILAHKKDRVSAYEIGRSAHNLAKNPRDLETATRALEVMGWITPDTKKGGASYSRADISLMKWRVNPRVHEIFAERAVAEEARRIEIREKIAKSEQTKKKLKIN